MDLYDQISKTAREHAQSLCYEELVERYVSMAVKVVALTECNKYQESRISSLEQQIKEMQQ